MKRMHHVSGVHPAVSVRLPTAYMKGRFAVCCGSLHWFFPPSFRQSAAFPVFPSRRIRLVSCSTKTDGLHGRLFQRCVLLSWLASWQMSVPVPYDANYSWQFNGINLLSCAPRTAKSIICG